MLLFSPFWTPIREMINGAQARPLLVPTSSARRHGLTATLEKMTTPHTRAIYYNTPQNPSGTVFTRDEAQEVAAFAKKYDLIVISDEAYEDLVYDGEHFSIASLPGMAERTISTFTFSKSYGMTGWRVGYLTAREPFMTGLRKLVLYSTNGVSTPSQWAALEALSLPETEFEKRRGQYRERRDLLVAGLNDLWPGMRNSARRVLRISTRAVDPPKRAAKRRRSCLRRRTLQRFQARSSALRGKVICALVMPPASTRFVPGLKLWAGISGVHDCCLIASHPCSIDLRRIRNCCTFWTFSGV